MEYDMWTCDPKSPQTLKVHQEEEDDVIAYADQLTYCGFLGRVTPHGMSLLLQLVTCCPALQVADLSHA